MFRRSSSACTRGRPGTTPRCWGSESSFASTRSPTHSARGWRSIFSMPGPIPMALTWMLWVLTHKPVLVFMHSMSVNANKRVMHMNTHTKQLEEDFEPALYINRMIGRLCLSMHGPTTSKKIGLMWVSLIVWIHPYSCTGLKCVTCTQLHMLVSCFFTALKKV